MSRYPWPRSLSTGRRVVRAAGFASAWLALLVHFGVSQAATVHITETLDPGKGIGGAAIAPNGAHALTWSQSEIRFWDLGSGHAFAEDESEEIPDCRRDSRGWVSPDGRFVALSCKGVVLIDMRVPKVVARLGEGSNTRMVSFSADSRRLVRLTESHRTLADGGDRLVQQLETYEIADYLDPSWLGDAFRSLFGYDENEPDAAFSLDRAPFEAVTSAIFASLPDQLLLDTPTTVEIRSLEGKVISSNGPSSAYEMTWSCPGGEYSVVTQAKFDSLDSILSRLSDVTDCVLGADQSDVWLAHGDLKTRWDVDSGKQLWFHSRQGGIAYLAATPDHRFLAVASTRGEVNLFDWKGRHVAMNDFPKKKVNGPAADECTPSDRLVLSADGQTVLFLDCKVYVWKAE